MSGLILPASYAPADDGSGRLRVQWSENALVDPRGPDLVSFNRRPGYGGVELILRLRAPDGRERLLTLPVRLGSSLPPVWPSQAPAAWGLSRASVPGVWLLDPSIVEEGIHAVIAVVGCPDPPFAVE